MLLGPRLLAVALLFPAHSAAAKTTHMADEPIRAVQWRQQWEALSPDIKAARQLLAKEIGSSKLIGDRTYHLQTYRQCFVASDAVKYVMDTGRADTRESAVTQLQQLVEGNLIHHVTFDHTFSDAKLFFRPSHGQEGPSIFSLAGDKKNALSWVRVSGVGFLGLGSNAAGVIGVDREHNAIHHFVNDIAPAPKSSIPITGDVQIKYLDESRGHALQVTDGQKGTKLTLTFRDDVSKEKFVEGVVACGGSVAEDQSDLIKNATSLFEFEATNLDGEKVSFETFRPKVCVVVNTASG